nr:hypothetical protein CFP56_57689 [Quercus suber]
MGEPALHDVGREDFLIYYGLASHDVTLRIGAGKHLEICRMDFVCTAFTFSPGSDAVQRDRYVLIAMPSRVWICFLSASRFENSATISSTRTTPNTSQRSRYHEAVFSSDGLAWQGFQNGHESSWHDTKRYKIAKVAAASTSRLRKTQSKQSTLPLQPYSHRHQSTMDHQAPEVYHRGDDAPIPAQGYSQLEHHSEKMDDSRTQVLPISPSTPYQGSAVAHSSLSRYEPIGADMHGSASRRRAWCSLWTLAAAIGMLCTLGGGIGIGYAVGHKSSTTSPSDIASP